MKICDLGDQTADVLTKALPQAKHDQFQQELDVFNFQSRGVLNIDSTPHASTKYSATHLLYKPCENHASYKTSNMVSLLLTVFMLKYQIYHFK